MLSDQAPSEHCERPLVLIVEDAPVQVKTLTSLLSELDCRIAVAISGEEALLASDRETPDLILLDRSLPDMDGLLALRNIKAQKRFQDIPVIIITARGGIDDIVSGLDAGAIDYIPKPFHPAELLARLKTHLKVRKLAKHQQALITELQEAVGAVKQLSGLIPICSHCKKIRNDTGYWQQVEDYIAKHTEALFTHGLCPECIPKFFPEAARAGLCPAPAAPPAHASEAVHRARILLVDDSPMSLQLLIRLLRIDHEVLVATHGSVALDLARNEQPDLILLDMLMPDMGGMEVCRALKADARTEQIPVIFVTGSGQKVDELEGFHLGAVDFIQKPFSIPLVQARVRTQLELKRFRDLLVSQLMRDPHTRLRNRQGFLDLLELMWKQAIRRRAGLALILFNIDSMKEFNQHCGRPAGDECIQRIAGTLKAMKRRSTDLLARSAGQEFACLLPDTDLAGAVQIAGAMMASVEDLAIPHPGLQDPPYVTLSAGVSACLPLCGTTPSTLLEQAEQALFLTRERGQNSLCVHPENPR